MTIRAAQPADAAAIAAIHVKSWQRAYRGLLPDELLQNLSVSQREAFWRRSLIEGSTTVLLNEVAGRVAGFISFGSSRDSEAGQATTEVYAIYLDPADWSHGHGAALIAAALEQLRRAGSKEVMLWVLDGNQRAIRFYERSSFAHDGATKVERHPSGVEFRELRYRRLL